MDSRAGPARRARTEYWTGPAQITGLRAVPGPRPRHMGRPGPVWISNRANQIELNRARAMLGRVARMANYTYMIPRDMFEDRSAKGLVT